MKVLVIEGESGKMVYCRLCVAVPGEPTKCPGYNHHDFSKVKVSMIQNR
jgi:hypothetical protein